MKTTYKMPSAECGVRNPLSRNTQHATRITPRASRAFSLVEMLVVISVILVLAGLSIPVMGSIKRAQSLKQAQAELLLVDSAIDRYQQKLGYYPPDNLGYYATNQLYFELQGTILTTNSAGIPMYQTLDGSAQITNTPTAFQAAFGINTTIVRFMNYAQAGQGNDEAPGARNFLPGLNSSHFLAVASPVVSTVLGLGIDGPVTFYRGSASVTPWCYNSSSPKYNAKSFDLWVDIILAGKTNRICNWSEKPLLVSTPY